MLRRFFSPGGSTGSPLTSTVSTGLPSVSCQRLDANRDYLALATPTAAQQRAQVARLTRENNALIRLVLGLLDTDDDTGD